MNSTQSPNRINMQHV